MKYTTLIRALIISSLIVSFSSFTKAQSFIQNRVFTVNYNGDSNDANAEDGICADESGRCSLRAAIQESDAIFGIDYIIFALPDSDTINLTLGELTIISSVYIVGPGARRLTVQRSYSAETPEFRIFHIQNFGGGFANIRGMTIKNGNVNTGLGGGVFVDNNRLLNLIDVTLSENKAKSGAAICNQGKLNLVRSLVNSNTSTNEGGAISSSTLSTIRILNSTITNNTARIGGAISNDGSLLSVNNTISHNSATETANCIYNFQNGTVYAMNTILAGNPSSTSSALSGSFSSLGNNLITDARNSAGFTNGVNNDQVSNNNAIDPKLNDLTDNGGQTNTRSLNLSSPAINKGNDCVKNANCSLPSNIPFFIMPSDQRISHHRKIDRNVDIGAFETGAFPTGLYNMIFGTQSINSQTYSGIAIATNVKNLEKTSAFVSPAGRSGFNGLDSSDIYLFEIKCKRQIIFPTLIIASNDTFISEQGFLQANEENKLIQKIIEK